MEDQDGSIYPCYGRFGNWFTFVSGNDWAAQLSPAPNTDFVMTNASRVTTSTYAAAFSGQTTKNGDCGMGVLLNTASNSARIYDLSKYGSIQFWYKTEGLPKDSTSLRIQLLLQSTVAPANYGTCTAGPVGSECNDHYSFVLPPASNWTQGKVLLAYSGSGPTVGFAQDSTWGLDVPFDLSLAMGVQFIVKEGFDAPFKVSVDDLVLAYP
jgi:hypothetical protein